MILWGFNPCYLIAHDSGGFFLALQVEDAEDFVSCSTVTSVTLPCASVQLQV